MKFFPGHWFSPPAAVLPAVTSGLLLAMAFAPVSLGVISFFALVPLTVALHGKPYPRGTYFKAGYLFGVAFFLALLWWIVLLVPAASATVPWLMTPALILAVAYLALYPALAMWLLAVLGRGKPFAAVLLCPALWILLEIFRSRGELGFPWGAVGYALSGSPYLIQTAAYAGLFGLGAIIVLVNMIWSYAFISRKARTRVISLVIGAAVVALLGLHGNMAVKDFASEREGDRVRIAVVQPNVDLFLKWDPSFADSTFRLIERLARHAAALGAELIVFPETSAPVYIHYDISRRTMLSNLAGELDASIFIGFLDGRYDGPGESLNVYNSSGVFQPEGGLFQYDKMHLLPFGEAIPLAWKFRFLKSIRFGQANFQPGPPVQPPPSRAGRLGPLICFESIFPELSRRLAEAGAAVLVNVTNDGWFGKTPGPYQHKDMCILRAVETGRYLLRSANTGISMVVDPVGRVLSSLGIGEEGVLVEEIDVDGGSTFYTRWGDLPVVVVLTALIVIGAIAARR